MQEIPCRVRRLFGGSLTGWLFRLSSALWLASASSVFAGNSADIAKQLTNPVGSLISLPFQLNYDRGIGERNGHRWLLNVQPVVPISLNDDWNLISRTILPIIVQDDVIPGQGGQSGLGDVVQSFFFSPKKPTRDGWIWGAGPVLLLPTATDSLLGARKWALGPTAVLLKQNNGWTYGALANHLWSVAGDGDRQDVNATLFQPFLSHTDQNAVTLAINTEAAYDWESRQWSVPLNLIASKVVSWGSQSVSIAAGIRYWLDSPDGGPEGFGFRLALTLLFPQ